MSYLNQYRKSSRKNFQKYMPADVDCKIKDIEFKAFVQNLSTTGAFIKTNKTLHIGQEIDLTINISNNGDKFKVTGEIVRIDPTGVGVEFKNYF